MTPDIYLGLQKNISPSVVKSVVLKILNLSDEYLKETNFKSRFGKDYFKKTHREVIQRAALARQLISYLVIKEYSMTGKELVELHKVINRKHPTALHEANVIQKELNFKGSRTEVINNCLTLFKNEIKEIGKLKVKT